MAKHGNKSITEQIEIRYHHLHEGLQAHNNRRKCIFKSY